jgi:maltose O-acetyltransferase
MPDGWYGGRDVTIGRDTTINYGVFFDTSARVSIGRRCDVGMQVMFCTGTHDFGVSDRRAGQSVSRPIVVEDGVWIGARAIVLPGVTIGRGCVIAAGAVVATSCEPDGLYAGIPARRIRDLSP